MGARQPTGVVRSGLFRRLRLIVIVDQTLSSRMPIEDVVLAALEAGAPAIQLRDKTRSVRELLPLAHELRRLTHDAGALFFVNDRLDLGLAVGADGVHLGPGDLPVAAVRSVTPDDFLIGYSTDDPETAKTAESDGADYIGCGTVWATESKADAGLPIGTAGVRRVASAVSIPVVAIGGVTSDRVAELPPEVAGVAVIGAIMSAPDPRIATARFLEALAIPSRNPSGG